MKRMRMRWVKRVLMLVLMLVCMLPLQAKQVLLELNARHHTTCGIHASAMLLHHVT